MKLPDEVRIPYYGELWRDVDRAEFGNWLQNTDYNSRLFTLTQFTVFSSRRKGRPLRFLFIDNESNVKKSDITFLQPLFDLQTLSNADADEIVTAFYNEFMADTDRLCAVLSGDQQTWIKFYMMHKRDPEKYRWLIPVPGEWHWTWHILKAIYIMYYDTILLPLALELGFSRLDKEVKDFHYAEDLLEMVTLAIVRWIEQSMDMCHPPITINKWLHNIKPHTPAYELAYACIHYFIPYWNTRSALKWNKIDVMESYWRYWIHLFIATKKYNYSLMSVRFLWILNSLDPEIKKMYEQYRVLSFSGDPGTGIPMDGVIELVGMLV